MSLIYRILLSVSFTFLIGSGLYFSIKLGFPQLKINSLFKGLKKDENTNISPLKSMMLSLAARIGVGSLSGIALAIYIGGEGTLFWIWIGSIITCILTYCETYLGQKYQVKINNTYVGGPSYYIKNKNIALLYAVILILTYTLGFLPIQANTIVKSMTNYLNINIYLVTIIILIITIIPIIGDTNKIMNLTSKIVPIIGLFYLLLTIYVLIRNISLIPNIILTIIKKAFNIKAFTSSFIPSLIIGIQRGIFITESGLGTSSIATSCTYTKDKISLSLSQILGIYFTVFIVCTSTAFLIMTSNYKDIIITTTNGIELTQYAYMYHLGNIGSLVLLISIFFLAYSTIVAGYFYSESSFKFISNKIYILKLITIFSILIGCIINATKLWNIADILVEILIIINAYYLFKYRKEIVFDYKK